MKRLLTALCALLFPTTAAAQYVEDATFCHEVVHDTCRRPLVHGTTVTLSALSGGSAERRVYFYARVRTIKEAQVGIVFQRDGTCVREQLKLPASKFNANPSLFQEIWTFLNSSTLASLWNRLGLGELTPGRKDLKVNMALLKPSPAHRIWDWRNVGCSGTLRARLFGSDGEPLPGHNGVREIRIVTQTAAAPVGLR